MEPKIKKIKISVRHLVEFLLRSGDLDESESGFASRQAMQAGSKIHRKIQKSRGGLYQAELPLKWQEDRDTYSLTVEGRADGLFLEKGIPVIEEIKGVYRDVTKMKEPVPVHLAQAKCYAAIYTLQNQKKVCRVLMTYADLDSEKIQQFRYKYPAEHLREWFLGLLEDYDRWARLLAYWQEARDGSIEKLNFPFDYRPGQKEAASYVYQAILDKKQIFLQAPTGIGKTISTLFPAVKAMGAGLSEKIFYLTAKTITRTAAEDAFRALKESGLKLRSLTFTAKEKVCILDRPACNPKDCPRAKGHFDRINDCLYDMLVRGRAYSREEILIQAESCQVCPYQLQKDLADFADAVICDYNYVFDPQARLSDFFGEGTRKGSYLFLIDEAHNLAERAREMFSASLFRSDVLEMRKRTDKEKHPELYRALDSLNRSLLTEEKKTKEEGGFRLLDAIDALAVPILNLSEQMETFLEDRENEDDEALNFYFHLIEFMQTAELIDPNYRIFESIDDKGQMEVRLLCANPASNLQQVLDKGRAAVFFSATLIPVKYYESMLSTRDDSYEVYIPSPFDRKKRLLLVGTDVTSRYSMRSPDIYRRYAAYIQKITSARPGNYMVFSPSYRFSEEILNAYEDLYPYDEAEILVQEAGMREEEREAFLASFQGTSSEGREQKESSFEAEERESGKNSSLGESSEIGRSSGTGRDRKTRIGFVIMGGIFAEGIDLAGDRLIGAIIIGTGYPMVTKERELLKSWYQENGRNGFSYAYSFPGMNKVQQSAGRVIRTFEDTGVIALLDGRFRENAMRSLFPKEWDDAVPCTSGTVQGIVEKFWKALL
ncbi:MAG: ATP-dependent DNA helicase [Eubacterium sp.]|nr:ATP-dependent DNA helicase [Eubacterium sp.]